MSGVSETWQAPELDYDAALNQFSADSVVVGRLHDQNSRYAQIGEKIEDPDFRDLAFEGLKAEQLGTIAELTASDNAPYRELAERHLAIEARLGELALRTSDFETELESSHSSIDETVETVIELAPVSRDPALSLAERKKVEADNDLRTELADIEAEIYLLGEEKQKLEGLYETAGIGWPVPIVVSHDHGSQGLVEIITDEIPLEPKLRDNGTSVSEKIDKLGKDRCVDAPEATKYVALYLSEHPGRVITVNELATFLYNEKVLESVSRMSIRARVTTILGPKSHRIIIQTLLDEYDLTLQYGRRTVRTIKDGKVVSTSRPHRIYRTIPKNEFRLEHLKTTESRRERITWQATPEQKEMMGESQGLDTPVRPDTPERKKRIIEAKNASSRLAEILIEAEGKYLTAEEISKLLYPQSKRPLSVLKNRIYALVAISREKGYQEKLAELGYSAVVGVKLVPNPKQPGHPNEIKAIRAVPLENESAGHIESLSKAKSLDSSAEKPLPKWAVAFQARVQEAIQIIEEEGLLADKPLQSSIVKARSKSHKMGTVTASRKLRDAGLISRDKYHSRQLEAADIVAMRLFDANHLYLRPGPRQKTALIVLTEEVRKALEAKAKKDSRAR